MPRGWGGAGTRPVVLRVSLALAGTQLGGLGQLSLHSAQGHTARSGWPRICPCKRCLVTQPAHPCGLLFTQASPHPPVFSLGSVLWDRHSRDPVKVIKQQRGWVFTLLGISSPSTCCAWQIITGPGGPHPRAQRNCHLEFTHVAPEEPPGCLVRPPSSPGTSGRRGTCPSPASGR